MGFWGEVFKLGPHAVLDQLMDKAIDGTFKGDGGFVTGLGRGMANQASSAYKWSGIGKVTNGAGYMAGKVANGTAKATSVIVGAPTLATGYAVYKTLPRDWEWLKKMSYSAWRNGTREVPEALAERGLIGLGGRIAKPGVGWGLGLGAVGLGVASSAEKFDYNLGLKTLTNGIMDTQGVSVTPGSIMPSYTPVSNSKKALRDLGVTGDLGFALHNQRHTGQI